jgi:hypothetical protein
MSKNVNRVLFAVGVVALAAASWGLFGREAPAGSQTTGNAPAHALANWEPRAHVAPAAMGTARIQTASYRAMGGGEEYEKWEVGSIVYDKDGYVVSILPPATGAHCTAQATVYYDPVAKKWVFVTADCLYPCDAGCQFCITDIPTGFSAGCFCSDTGCP